jgi:hypothetical protein
MARRIRTASGPGSSTARAASAARSLEAANTIDVLWNAAPTLSRLDLPATAYVINRAMRFRVAASFDLRRAAFTALD